MGTFRGSNLRRRGGGSEVSAYLPITPFDPEASLEHYWTNAEATGVTRADSVGSNDMTVTTGPATQVAAHLGNGVDDCELDMTSGPTVGAAGYTFGWWQEAVSAGSPSTAGIWLLGGEGFVLITADVGVTNIQASVTGRPSDTARSTTQSIGVVPEVWQFICVVVDDVGVTMYGGDDTGTALAVTNSPTWSGVDTFAAPLAWTLNHTQALSSLDDMFFHSIPLDADGVGEFYNGGAGLALF